MLLLHVLLLPVLLLLPLLLPRALLLLSLHGGGERLPEVGGQSLQWLQHCMVLLLLLPYSWCCCGCLGEAAADWCELLPCAAMQRI
jgi:hypothetical protein